jgi:hypothetical protein
VRFIDETADYQTGSVTARAEQGGDGGGVDADLPVVCDAALATSAARRALATGGEGERLTVRLGPLQALKLEPGDVVEVEGRAGEWRAVRLDWDEQPTATLEPVVRIASAEATPDWRPGEPPIVVGAPFLRLLDLPPIPVFGPGAEDDGRPVAVIAAEPWRPMTLHGGQDAATLTPRASVTQPATVGMLMTPLTRGVLGRWDEANAITVRIEGTAPQSLSAAAVLGGSNAVAVETAAGWEVVQYRRADLVGGEIWRLSGLLRGQQGSEAATAAGASIGALMVMLDRNLPRVDMSADERGLPRLWRAGPAGAPPGGAGFAEITYTWEVRSARPWRPAHLGATVEGGGRRLSWTPRVWIGGDRWDLEPLEVDPRRFRVRVLDDGVEKRVWEVEGLETVYAAGPMAADFPGGPGAGARIAVAQWGEGYGWGSEAVARLL